MRKETILAITRAHESAMAQEALVHVYWEVVYSQGPGPASQQLYASIQRLGVNCRNSLREAQQLLLEELMPAQPQRLSLMAKMVYTIRRFFSSVWHR